MRCWKPRFFVAAVGTAAALSFIPSDAARAEPVVTCTLGARVACRITEPYGIRRVVVERRTAIGKSKAIDKSYACVLATSVAWTPAESAAELKVTPCRDPDLRDYASFGPLEGTPFLNRRFELLYLDTNDDGHADAVDAHYATFAQMGFDLDPVTGDTRNVICDNDTTCESMADFCDSEGGVGTCYEDHCVCDVP
jgi:hypothetical protein